MNSLKYKLTKLSVILSFFFHEVLQLLRDCSLFMPMGGSVIFKQFRLLKNLPLPGSGYFKKLPPIYVTGPKCNPPYPHPLPSGRDVPPIAKLHTTRVLAGCR